MAIKLKVVKSAKEIDDVLKLRHQSYVVEDGKFGGKPLPTGRISDHFDALPGLANIIAYDDETAVGTIRVSLDTGVGLPPEEYYDFSNYRSTIERKAYEKGEQVRLASGGMFAILEKWKGRRNVVSAIMRMGVGVYHNWGVTHVIANSNHETVSLYKHLGFEELREPVWVDEIGNHIVPMAATFEKMFEWAFGRLFKSSLDEFWVSAFSGHFERILLSPGEVLFNEGEIAAHAFIIDDGWVSISRKDPEGAELTLATLSHGELFGELALLDEEPRSGTAKAETHTELICFSHKDFFSYIENEPHMVKQLLKLFSQRIRRIDELAIVMAFAPQTGRVEYALNTLKQTAVADRKRKNTKFVRLGPSEIAKSAGVREHEVRRILEKEKLKGHLDYGNRIIRFYN